MALSGPVYLPEKRKLVTLHRSAHADNKSREQRAVRVSRRLWVIDFAFDSTVEGFEVFNKIFFFELLGAFEEIKKQGISFDWSLSLNLLSPLSLMVRTPPFRGGNTSSNLVEDRKKKMLLKLCHRSILFIWLTQALGH